MTQYQNTFPECSQEARNQQQFLLVLYNIVLKPLLAVLWVAAEHMPDDFGSETVDDMTDKAAGAFASFVDNHVFSQPEPNYVIVPDEEYKANFKF